MKRPATRTRRPPGYAVTVIVVGVLAGRVDVAVDAQSIELAAAIHQPETLMESRKRRIPVVAPVEAGGVRYEVLRGARARGFGQNGGIIAAIDIASGETLWTLTVYQNNDVTSEETDVQDRYITALRLSEDCRQLLVDAEGPQTYMVDLERRKPAPRS